MSSVGPGEPQSAAKTAIDAEIEQVVNSALFRKSPALRDLLISLWKHREQPLSEYALGVEVLRRRPDFDPKTDATVRVQISRLRQRLKEYYDTEGRQQIRRVQIPFGEYRAEIVTASLPETPEVPAARPARSWRRAALPLLSIAVAVLAIDNFRLRKAATPAPSALHSFWQPFVKKGAPVPIMVPAPLFFRWGDQPFVARDFRVGAPEQLTESPFLELLTEKYGKPDTNQLYTVASDTVAASRLTRYLEDHGVPVAVVDTSAAPMDLLATRDAIIFVGPGSTPDLAPLLDRMNFYIRPNGGGVYNRAPRDIEPVRYSDVQHAPLRTTTHGILARLPGRSPGTRVLLFGSSFNPALVALVTTPAELDSLEAYRLKNGGDAFFEVVVRYDRNADRVLRATPIAYRSIPATH